MTGEEKAKQAFVTMLGLSTEQAVCFDRDVAALVNITDETMPRLYGGLLFVDGYTFVWDATNEKWRDLLK